MTVITQSYEWVTVWFIMKWQEGKTLGEIIHKLSHDGTSKFQLIETLIFIVFSIIMLSYVVFRGFVETDDSHQFAFGYGPEIQAVDYAIITLFTLVFIPYVFTLYKHHNAVY